MAAKAVCSSLSREIYAKPDTQDSYWARTILRPLAPSADEVKTDALKNPAARAEWDRTAVARDVASRVVRYRAERELSQVDLGKARRGAAFRRPARERGPVAVAEHPGQTRPAARFHIDVTPTNVRLSA